MAKAAPLLYTPHPQHKRQSLPDSGLRSGLGALQKMLSVVPSSPQATTEAETLDQVRGHHHVLAARVSRRQGQGQGETLNPQPETSTLNPRPSTPYPKSYPLHINSLTLNPKP